MYVVPSVTFSEYGRVKTATIKIELGLDLLGPFPTESEREREEREFCFNPSGVIVQIGQSVYQEGCVIL